MVFGLVVTVSKTVWLRMAIPIEGNENDQIGFNSIREGLRVTWERICSWLESGGVNGGSKLEKAIHFRHLTEKVG
jgi:hypothetical protein